MKNYGLIFAGVYGAIALYLIYTQGLMGESFIAIILGLPWSMFFSFFEYFGVEGPVLPILLLMPLGLNAYILYRVGRVIQRG